jgi:hypothetical protein
MKRERKKELISLFNEFIDAVYACRDDDDPDTYEFSVLSTQINDLLDSYHKLMDLPVEEGGDL